MATSARLKEANLNPWISSAGDSPARTSAWHRGRASASSAHAPGSGVSLLGCSVKYGLDSRLLKMFPPFAVADLPWSFKISGRSGLMRNGIVFRLPPLARLTGETESLSSPASRGCSCGRSSGAKLLPTLTANRWSGLQSHGVNAMLGPLNPEWCEWFMGFPIGWTASPPSDERSYPKSPNGSANKS